MGGKSDPVFSSILVTGIILAAAITLYFTRKHGKKFTHDTFKLAFTGCFLGIVAGFIIGLILGLDSFTPKSFFIFLPCILATTYLLNYIYVIRGHPITAAERKPRKDREVTENNIELIRWALYPFMALSAAGLLYSAFIHVNSLITDHYALNRTVMNIIFAGAVLVWVPAYVAANRVRKLPAHLGQSGFLEHSKAWAIVFRGTPKWMLALLYILFAYAALNFIVRIMGLAEGSAIYRLYSAVWMLIYYSSGAVMYSALRANEAGKK